MMGDRFVKLHLRFALDSFRRDLERPGKRQRNREPNNKNEDDNLHRPLRRIERGKKNRCRLNGEPRDHRIRDGNLVNITPLQLGKEVVDLHFGFSSQSFWKRGSPRNGSHCGSSFRSAGVRKLLYGTSKRCSSLGIARSLSPTMTSTDARFSSALGPSTASFALGSSVIARSASFIAASFSPSTA